jgi:hypothetical protein
MNCPHGCAFEEDCHRRPCVQDTFAHGRQSIAIRKLYCDTCGHGVAMRKNSRRRGLNGRSILAFNEKHGPHTGCETYWKAVDVDTKAELLGRGPPPIEYDGDDVAELQ